MRAFNVCAVCAMLSAAFLYFTFSGDSPEIVQLRQQVVDRSLNEAATRSQDFEGRDRAMKQAELILDGREYPESELPSCSDVNTMPCTTVAPDDPVRQQLEESSKSGPFKKGQKVTCIYPAIAYEWHDLENQIVKNVGAKCVVTDASDVWNDIEPGYQHVKVNCEKDLRARAQTDHIADNELNKGERWMFSNNCYHF